MNFDITQHQITQIILRAGDVIRELKGLPKENNITTLYNETASILGISFPKLNSRIASSPPNLSDMRNNNGKFVVPRKDCPNCGKVDSYTLFPVCPNCKDSEGGKYHSGWKCNKKTGGCGYIGDKSEKFFTQRMRDEFPDIVIPDGSKLSLGIETIVDKEK